MNIVFHNKIVKIIKYYQVELILLIIKIKLFMN